MGIIKDKLRGKGNSLTAIFNRYGVTEVRIFGSVAEGNDTAKSDIDIVGKCDLFKGSFSGKYLRSLGGVLGYWVSVDFLRDALRNELHEELTPIKWVDLCLIYQGQRAIQNDRSGHRIFDRAIPIEKFY